MDNGRYFLLSSPELSLRNPFMPDQIIFIAGKESTIIRKPGLSSCSKKRVLNTGSICIPASGIQSVSIILSVMAETGIPARPKKYIPFLSSTVIDQPPVSVRATISYRPGFQKIIL